MSKVLMAPTVVYARASTSFTIEHGLIVQLFAGQMWPSNDPVVIARPELFSESPMVMTSDRGFVPLDQA